MKLIIYDFECMMALAAGIFLGLGLCLGLVFTGIATTIIETKIIEVHVFVILTVLSIPISLILLWGIRFKKSSKLFEYKIYESSELQRLTEVAEQ